ncbi:hypothetical protein [Methylophaga sp. UBA2689]|uniref:hypothetical protein n=1 Tax=Methylophaga sp. UBA2689 TaxID=1946878 RepID=UPI0025D6B7F8|nr:hypothetical protein [Methylophaga sp. UBA2689]|tara:strand:- start:6649 stop:7317 length:669 start_codon:yes stop_codon:yes gene_type:complete
MGLINFGLPEAETKFLKENLGLNCLVEGGTYRGVTAKRMSFIFESIYTIEKSEEMFRIAENNLSEISNVIMLKGDTRQYLSKLLTENDNILFWLDAHWSGGKTYGKGDECPLIEELNIIFSYKKNYIIMIDDARLFLSPPPLPHEIRNWPSLSEIYKVLPDGWDLLILDDVIYLFPEKISEKFKIFIQKIVTNKTNTKVLVAPTMLNGFKIVMKSIVAGKIL